MSDVTTHERVEPVHVEDLPADAAPPPPVASERVDVGRAPDERADRLRDGADELKNKRVRALLERPNLLIGVAATLMTIGLSLILMGWAGTSRSIYLEEQISYVISGGILGGALAVIGALTLFTHWLTVSIREARARDVRREQQHTELMVALEKLSANGHGDAGAVLAQILEGGEHGHAGSQRPQRPLRAAPRSS